MVLDTRFELVATSMSWRHSTAELIEQLFYRISASHRSTLLTGSYGHLYFVGRNYSQEILKSGTIQSLQTQALSMQSLSRYPLASLCPAVNAFFKFSYAFILS